MGNRGRETNILLQDLKTKKMQKEVFIDGASLIVTQFQIKTKINLGILLNKNFYNEKLLCFVKYIYKLIFKKLSEKFEVDD